MSRIPVPAIEHAPTESQPLLSGVKSRLGNVPNMYRIMANSPAALEAFLGFYSALDKGDVDPLTRERIALAVAEANGCEILPIGADAPRPQGRDVR
jgi:alkylhydroperoxidase family enzyme